MQVAASCSLVYSDLENLHDKATHKSGKTISILKYAAQLEVCWYRKQCVESIIKVEIERILHTTTLRLNLLACAKGRPKNVGLG